MVERGRGSPDRDEPIVPTRIADLGVPEDEAHGTQFKFQRAALFGVSIVLFLAVLTVLFVLPKFVGPTDDSAMTAKSTAAAPPSAATEPPVTETTALDPDEAAELRRRNQAQLEQILGLSELLEQRNVRSWAADAFEAAKKEIENGEKAYREQRYRAAEASYDQAIAALQAIEAETEGVVHSAIDDGYAAIADGNSAMAIKRFEFALAIAPTNESARSGLARAASLDKVLALIKEAAGYEELENLDAAEKRYSEALALDAEAPGAAEAIARIRQTRLDIRFRQVMSEGLNAFDAKQDAKAKSAFEQAVKLKPSAADARAALAQVNNRILVNEISGHLSEAAKLERAEKWTAAASAYRKAVSLDPELDGAAASAKRADARAKLDQQLELVLNKPERLADDEVHREALAVLARARAENDPGPRLSNQIARLTQTIKLARKPVNMTLVSDSATDVTVYKIGRLGRFDRHPLAIIPGRYIVVGKRDGFRDVRVEFEVRAGEPGAEVTVRCEQKLAFGN